MLKKMCLWAAVIMSLNAWAQMPHQVLLLVNKQSPASMKVANTYLAARQIPACNLVYLDIPETVYGGSATITPEQFTKLIWDPVNAVVKERGLDQAVCRSERPHTGGSDVQHVPGSLQGWRR